MPSDAVSLLWKAEDFLRAKLGAAFKPEWALVLGSGLEDVVQEAKNSVTISYAEIPGFSTLAVAGHAGKLIACELFGKQILVYSGRFHFYEGHSMEKVIFPVRLASFFGCKKLILTAAAGGIDRKLKAGDIVIVEDHINFMGDNPLRGAHDPAFGERFADFTAVYSEKLRKEALALAKKAKLRAVPGVYAAMSGPSYETPAEINALASLGADIVGMSVVPEAAVAHQMGMQVLALCFVANQAAGVSKTPLRHDEVLASGKKSAGAISSLIRGVLCSPRT
ncbi:MAG: purine-nucleoside phosphorylase [Elusimicrobia bacterium RIFCSPLOWO2_01_FULL_54_10]|nr:MAG: purine-nucleoside phosphorylase [Elusimicrobia bacterium RIFCSPLOWO2_01_FULL_54_10]